jgi:hypothetical protein
MLDGHAMAQAVCHCPATMEARVQHQVSLCGICGGQKWHEDRVSSVSVMPPMLHILSFTPFIPFIPLYVIFNKNSNSI